VLTGTCDTPKSQLFTELPPEPEFKSRLQDYVMMPDMPSEQKRFIASKQRELIDLKNKIQYRRL
jgi:hypothetical protein